MRFKTAKFILYFSILLIIINNTICYAANGPETKNLYLTFDDGPSIITNDLLDTLKECNVKATFFVVGKEIVGREAVLKRIYNEGHSIGLHTYSHNFHKIYKNKETFIKEMTDTRELVEKVTGYSPNLIRFPGGSSKHLSKNMLDLIHENNFKVFDWNISIEDGVRPDLSKEELLKNAQKCKTCEKSVILLMHCNSNNQNTIKALPSIINYYKSRGYKISPITEATPEYYYKIKCK